MILIADSGSSTTEWRLLYGEIISQHQCIGLNPYIVDEHIIRVTLSQLDIPFDKITAEDLEKIRGEKKNTKRS